jgi:citrate synthase
MLNNSRSLARSKFMKNYASKRYIDPLYLFRVMTNATYHDGLDRFIKAFRHDSHPMGMMSTLMAAMSTFYPEANPAYVGANIYKSKVERNKHIYRILGSAPSIAAACYRHRIGLPLN